MRSLRAFAVFLLLVSFSIALQAQTARLVAIRVTGASVFGGVKVRGLELSNGIFSQHSFETPGYTRAVQRLHIDATSVFGGVKIKR